MGNLRLRHGYFRVDNCEGETIYTIFEGDERDFYLEEAKNLLTKLGYIKKATPDYFYTLASDNGEIMLGSYKEIDDFPALIQKAIEEVGENLYDIAKFLKKAYDIHRIVTPRYYHIHTKSTVVLGND